MEFQGKIKVSEALEELARVGIDVTRATLIDWCKKHGLGIQLGSPKGPWWVDKQKLKEFMTKGTHDKKRKGGAVKH